MSKNTEIELKLVVSKDNLKKMLELDFVTNAIRKDGQKKRKLVSSYYDTDDLILKKHGIAYRVRDKGDGTFEATVKTSRRNSAGLSERLELNLPLEKDMAVLEGFKDLGLEYDLTELAPNGVEKLFKVIVERTTYILDLDGAVAELAIDNGRISAGRARDKIEEVEIELLEGDQGVLLDFAARLAAEVPMFVEKRSKFVRGLALRGIAADEEAVRPKISNNESHTGFVFALQQHCDALLDCQKELLAEALDEDVLKVIKKELGYMHSLIACVETVTEHPLKEAVEEQLGNWQQQVEGCLNLVEMQEVWKKQMEAEDDLLARNSLEKKLDSVYIEHLNRLISMAHSGSLTSAVFGVVSWLYGCKWEKEEHIKAQDIAEKCLDKWMVSKKEAVTVQEKLVHVENMLFLAKSMSGKLYAREADGLKKNRRKLQERVSLQAKKQILLDLMDNSTSKVLYRDCGIMLGFFLAQK